MRRIAVIEDEAEHSEYLTALLKGAGYAVEAYPTAGRFMDSLTATPPDLVLLDLQMPGVDGWDVIRMLREKPLTRELPVIILSGRYRQSRDVVRAVGLGADEFFPKPVEGEVLLARIAALLRRASWRSTRSVSDEKAASAGPVEMDFAARSVRLHGTPIRLTRLEFDLLACLVQNVNRVLTRNLLLEQVWKSSSSKTIRAVDKRIETLRAKLGRFGRSIRTVSGVGYSLKLSV